MARLPEGTVLILLALGAHLLILMGNPFGIFRPRIGSPLNIQEKTDLYTTMLLAGPFTSILLIVIMAGF